MGDSVKIFLVDTNGKKNIVIENNGDLYIFDGYKYGIRDINELILSNFNLSVIDFSKLEKLSSSYRILSPIEYPNQDIICIGMNYIDHKEEVELVSKEDFAKDVDTIYFSKRANKVLGDGDIIPINNEITACLDYEIELGVIIGKDCKNVKSTEVSDYIFGFTIINDLSARDLQAGYKQWYYGKSFDGSSVMGPCILLNDGKFNYNNLDLITKVNGEIRQQNNTKNMILSTNEIIEDLSKAMTLKAGSIIATGTPSGVGMSFSPTRYLEENDKLEMEISYIGKLTNTVG